MDQGPDNPEPDDDVSIYGFIDAMNEFIGEQRRRLAPYLDELRDAEGVRSEEFLGGRFVSFRSFSTWLSKYYLEIQAAWQRAETAKSQGRPSGANIALPGDVFESVDQFLVWLDEYWPDIEEAWLTVEAARDAEAVRSAEGAERARLETFQHACGKPGELQRFARRVWFGLALASLVGLVGSCIVLFGSSGDDAGEVWLLALLVLPVPFGCFLGLGINLLADDHWLKDPNHWFNRAMAALARLDLADGEVQQTEGLRNSYEIYGAQEWRHTEWHQSHEPEQAQQTHFHAPMNSGGGPICVFCDQPGIAQTASGWMCGLHAHGLL